MHTKEWNYHQQIEISKYNSLCVFCASKNTDKLVWLQWKRVVLAGLNLKNIRIKYINMLNKVSFNILGQELSYGTFSS